MPELPEVETVRRQLEVQISGPQKIVDIKFSKYDLRSPFPRKKKDFFLNQVIVGFERRSKYLIFRFESGDGILTHLGMTGKWRLQPMVTPQEKHDHVVITLLDSKTQKLTFLIYQDPRRFGYFEILKAKTPHVLLKKLGSEPLGSEFTAQGLYEKVHSRRSPIKNLLMNASIVVGVGNIYASEALFRAQVSPLKSGHRLKKLEVQKIHQAIRETLQESLVFGGASIDDYRHVSGEKGSYQNRLNVYDREGFTCRKCAQIIRKKVLAGRSTFWCPKCQK